ncbi:hypothetical protein E1B28_006947 [Marasmius oreades]|uniref:Uncharacterized protein n=1 Tax=Marasmius oreades TaxID=181124 RepID=A0A9P7S0L8_9AGAR|nr:uncharacterized protein E1B28_006947 [Marasmius oreades]KAG7093264.1 hypothetical protein E1B28_006947 [Marasmius oreades]
MPITNLPLEIIHMILNFVVHPGDDLETGHLTWETRRALRACSLISYLWLADSRKRLFRTIPVPSTDTSLHAFKRLFSSLNLTFGPADLQVLDVTGQAPAGWGWQWWRTHQRKVKSERDRTDESYWENIRTFDRFFDWLSHDWSAAKVLGGLVEMRLFEVAFETPSFRFRNSGWVFLTSQTQHSLHQSFPSLTKLVLQRVRFSNSVMFTSFLGSFTKTLQMLEMECVEVEHCNHFRSSDGKSTEPLLPNLHTLRTTGTAVEWTAYLSPLPNLRTASFDIGDEDLRREQISTILADALASSERLQNLSLLNSCSGSFRNAEPVDNGNHLSYSLHQLKISLGPFLTRIIAKAPSIEHLIVDIRALDANAHLVPMFTQKHPNPWLRSLHIPELPKYRGDYGLLDDILRHTFPQLQVLQFNLRVPNTSAMMAKRRSTATPSPLTFHIPMIPTIGMHVSNDGGDDDEERDEVDSTLGIGASDVAYGEELVTEAQLFPIMDRVSRLAKVEATLERLRKEEEEFAVKTREQRARHVFEKFARQMPWCYEERGCLRPAYFYDK